MKGCAKIIESILFLTYSPMDQKVNYYIAQPIKWYFQKLNSLESKITGMCAY